MDDLKRKNWEDKSWEGYNYEDEDFPNPPAWWYCVFVLGLVFLGYAFASFC